MAVSKKTTKKKPRKKKAKKEAPNTQVGRPSKLIPFLEAFEALVNQDDSAVILTDEELVFGANEMLKPEDRIGQRTFERWKADGANADDAQDSHAYNEFWRLYKKALIVQKSQLFEKLKKNPIAWQRYAWIIERKFDDWNLRTKSENDHNIGGATINIIKQYPKE